MKITEIVLFGGHVSFQGCNTVISGTFFGRKQFSDAFLGGARFAVLNCGADTNNMKQNTCRKSEKRGLA